MKISFSKHLQIRSNACIFQVLLLVFIFFNTKVKAQDSLIVSNHLTDSQVRNQIFSYPIVFTHQYIKDFAFTEVSYEHQKNEFSRRQIANEITTFQFLAKGHFTTPKKWKLFGDLAIRKIDEKDLGWVLSDDRSEYQEVIAPHYFFVPRKADWTNQQYRIKGGFSKEITNRISIAATLRYNAEKYSRNLDPRPEIIAVKLGGELQLGYQIAENHKAFLLGEYTRKDKDFSYLYKDDHLNFEAYPETYLRFNAGYGRVVNYYVSNYNKRFLYKDISNKIGAGYTFNTKNTTITALYYNQKVSTDFYTSVFGTDNNTRLKYDVKNNHGELFAMHKWDKKEFTSTLKFDNSSGINYDVNSGGYNYKNTLNSLNWITSVAKKTNSKIDYLFGFNVNYQNNSYKDVLATSNMELNSLNTGIFGSKDFSFGKSKLNSTVSFNMYFPLPSSLEYYDTSGGTNAAFFDEVIRYDYAISTTNYFAPALRLEYSYPVKNGKTVLFFANWREKIALKKQTDYPVAINTNNTSWFQLGIQLNY